jgi:hypothetical protein
MSTTPRDSTDRVANLARAVRDLAEAAQIFGKVKDQAALNATCEAARAITSEIEGALKPDPVTELLEG